MHYQWEYLMNEQILQCKTKTDFLQQKLLVGSILQPSGERLLDLEDMGTMISKKQDYYEITYLSSASLPSIHSLLSTISETKVARSSNPTKKSSQVSPKMQIHRTTTSYPGQQSIQNIRGQVLMYASRAESAIPLCRSPCSSPCNGSYNYQEALFWPPRSLFQFKMRQPHRTEEEAALIQGHCAPPGVGIPSNNSISTAFRIPSRGTSIHKSYHIQGNPKIWLSARYLQHHQYR